MSKEYYKYDRFDQAVICIHQEPFTADLDKIRSVFILTSDYDPLSVD